MTIPKIRKILKERYSEPLSVIMTDSNGDYDDNLITVKAVGVGTMIPLEIRRVYANIELIPTSHVNSYRLLLRRKVWENLLNDLPVISITPEDDEDNVTVMCDDCEESVSEELTNNVGSRIVCESCIEDYSQCSDCEDLFDYDNDEDSVRTDNNTYCGSCADENAFNCEGCEENYERDMAFTHDGIAYCENCYNEQFSYCDACDNSYPSDEVRYCEDCGEDCEVNYCNDCWDDHEHNEAGLTEEQRTERERIRTEAQAQAVSENELRNPWREVNGEHFKGKLPTRYITVDRLVGIEIEGEKGDSYGIGKKVVPEIGISTDGSLHDRGIEMQTPPASLDKVEEFVANACKALEESGYKATKNTGIHVHIDATDIRKNHKKILQVIKTFYAVEDIFYSMLPPSRWSSTYCKRLSQDYLYSTFREKTNVKDIQKEWYKETTDLRIDERSKHKYDRARYYGLNVHSIFFRGTIELRYHSGTISPQKILMWASLLLLVTDWAINHYDEDEVSKLFDMETGYGKFDIFNNLFKVPYELNDYILDRVSKFNPNFTVKFNKGKKIRTTERRQIASQKKKIDLVIAKQEKLMFEKLKAHHLKNRNNGYTFEIPTDAEIKEEAKLRVKQELEFLLPKDLKDIMPDGGFIKNTEIQTIQTFIQQGINLQQNNVDGEEME